MTAVLAPPTVSPAPTTAALAPPAVSPASPTAAPAPPAVILQPREAGSAGSQKREVGILGRVFQTLASGIPSTLLASHLGIDQGLADACVDYWVRVGLVTPTGDISIGCTSCSAPSGGLPGADRPPSCRGCPFTR